ncbi:hypothetical protein IW136_002830 [Coemansia sp. RSA 678]|nr:hypothetical protein IW136_002830 [Coemansia sp. RSA 678]
MTSKLPPELLQLFTPRPPLKYVKPTDCPPDQHPAPKVTGIGAYLTELLAAPPGEPVETPQQRKERQKAERALQARDNVMRGISTWDPSLNLQATEDPYKTIIVARLHYDVTEKDIREKFEAYGDIVSIKMVKDMEGNFRGYAFIEYAHESDMREAFRSADGTRILGRRIVVDVERGRTVKGWLPRKFGGGLGGTRIGSKEQNQQQPAETGAMATAEWLPTADIVGMSAVGAELERRIAQTDALIVAAETMTGNMGVIVVGIIIMIETATMTEVIAMTGMGIGIGAAHRRGPYGVIARMIAMVQAAHGILASGGEDKASPDPAEDKTKYSDTKPVATSGVKVQRYFPGKGPQDGGIEDLSASESEGEHEPTGTLGTQSIAIAKLADTLITGGSTDTESESESDSAKRLLQARLRARQQAANASSSDSDSDNDQERAQTNRREQAALRRQQAVSEDELSANGTASSSGSGSDSEDSVSEDDYAAPIMLKPMFVPKSQRIAPTNAVSTRDGVEASTDSLKHAHREESVRMAAAEAHRARNEVEIPDRDESMVDDSDDIDVSAEYEAWKLRELLRIKRDKEEQEEADREEAERDRVRNMTEEERIAAGNERARAAREEKAKLRMEQADEQRATRDAPNTDDQLTRDMLEYAKKRDKPRASNSKWRGYQNEDTTGSRSLWSERRPRHGDRSLDK